MTVTAILYRDRIMTARTFRPTGAAATAVVRRDRVVVAKVGVPGPPGPPGSGVAYTHTQSAPAATWTINHNLGYRPAVTALTVGGAEMETEVVHTSINQTIIYLAAAMAGSARLI